MILASSILLKSSLVNRRIISSLNFNLESLLLLLLLFLQNIFIVTNLTDFHKKEETGVDLHLIRIEELNVRALTS